MSSLILHLHAAHDEKSTPRWCPIRAVRAFIKGHTLEIFFIFLAVLIVASAILNFDVI